MNVCTVDGCNEPKIPGRGTRYCAHHKAEALERYRLKQLARAHQPCSRCGGSKGEAPLKKGQRFCPPCAVIMAAEALERRRQRDRVIYASSRPATPERAAARKLASRTRVVRAQPPPKVPAEIRAAWSKSHPNSIMRKLCPTQQALALRFGRR